MSGKKDFKEVTPEEYTTLAEYLDNKCISAYDLNEITRFIDCYELLTTKELTLEAIIEHNTKRFLAIYGKMKITTKICIINKFIDINDINIRSEEDETADKLSVYTKLCEINEGQIIDQIFLYNSFT